MAEEYGRRRELVYGLLNDIPDFKTNMPQGAFYFFPDVSSYFGKSVGDRKIISASDFCIYLLEEANVSLVTGEAFGDPNCIRLSYAASEENLREALKRVKVALAQLN